MSSKKNDFTQPSQREKELQGLVNGIQSTFPSGKNIVVNGIDYDQPGFLAAAQGFLTPETAARQGHITLQKLVAAKDANKIPADQFYEYSKTSLIAFFGDANVEQLGAFGIKPPKKRAKVAAAENVLKAAKASETREARDTMGSKEKASIKGTTPTSVTVAETGKVTPETAPGTGGGGPKTT
jgi:hypothetical protein